MTENKKHLYNLDELSDYKVAHGYPNVKGWNVKDKDNRVIGEVENLLVNLASKRVVYLDVEVDKSIIDANYDPYSHTVNHEVREFINKDGENHIIIPIGLVDINEDQKFVYTETVDHRTFAETKRYMKGTEIDRNYEVAVMDSYDRTNIETTTVDENRVRSIVHEEVSEIADKNDAHTNLESDQKLREIVREELKAQRDAKTVFSENTDNDLSMSKDYESSKLAADRRRLHRDDFERKNVDDDQGLDFDHDNDGNPNITDPDYYEKKASQIKNADYDHDNDGNPNITDPDYYQKKGSQIKNADYDHDNDGNPNITDPDYYEDKLKGRDERHFESNNQADEWDFNENDDFYNRREFGNRRYRED